MELNELEEMFVCDVVVESSTQVYHEMRDIKSWSKEAFVAFYLDTRNKVISREIISVGTLDAAIIHPREVFRTAIMRNAASVVIAHNHPSGGLSPSNDDIEITKQLTKAGELIGIQLIDHVIVSRDGFYSFCDKGEI